MPQQVPSNGRAMMVVCLGAVLAISVFSQIGPAPKPTDQTPKPQPPPGKFSIDNARTIFGPNSEAGEVQSTVVPPATNSVCPKGRLLVSNDNQKPPKVGTVVYRDLDKLDEVNTKATFDPLPSSDVEIVSNDHDLLALPNGAVLLVWMGRSKAPLNPEPDWFDDTFKVAKDPANDWGPGARSAMMIWRSEDCGGHFKFVSSIDTASLLDGSPAFPQKITKKLVDAGREMPPYHMGGTDGPLTYVDPATGRLYMTMRVEGYLDADPAAGSYKMGDRVNKTVVVTSTDKGSSWQTLGALEGRGWRLGVVAVNSNTLAFGLDNTVRLAHKQGGQYEFEKEGDETLLLLWKKNWDWNGDWDGNGDWDATPQYTLINVKVTAHTRFFPSPSRKYGVLMHQADFLLDGKGYAIFFYDWANGTFATNKMAGIVPKNLHKDNLVLHPTVINLGSGPIFIYWYDIDWTTKSATMRGRLMTADDEWTSDFPISWKRSGFQKFPLGNDRQWYGDYHTAGGYWGLSLNGPAIYYYFPVWVEADGSVRFARVVCQLPLPPLQQSKSMVSFYKLSHGDWSTRRRRSRGSIPIKGEEP